MKTPCENCICLAICKAESYQYDYSDSRINPKTYYKCGDFLWRYSYENGLDIEKLLDTIRLFFRPDLPPFKFGTRHENLGNINEN